MKKFDDNEFPYNFDSITQRVALNGAPHWVLRREEYNTEVNSKSLKVALVYFDPAKDTTKNGGFGPRFKRGLRTNSA